MQAGGVELVLGGARAAASALFVSSLSLFPVRNIHKNYGIHSNFHSFLTIKVRSL